MATKSNKKVTKASVTVLADIRRRVWANGIDEAGLIAALRAAGPDQKSVRDEAVHTRHAVTLYPAMDVDAAVAKVRAMYGDKKKRTLAFNAALSAASSWYSRLLKKHDVKTTSKRGGARQTMVAKSTPAIADKANQVATDGAAIAPAPAPIVPPTAINGIAVAAYMETQAAAMLGYINKNAKHVPGEYRAAVTAFVAAIKAAKH